MAKGYWAQQLQNAAGAFFGTPQAPGGMYFKDFRHASKTFVSDSYALAPKYKFLFHVEFGINTESVQPFWGTEQPNFGLLVKDVRLPSYRFNTSILNQYNRKRIAQSKINYEPVEINFHDDNSNVINKLWYAYYTYYYKDAVKGGSLTNNTPNTPNPYDRTRNIYSYDMDSKLDWGYIGEPTGTSAGTNSPSGQGVSKQSFFSYVKIFGFNQHKFTQYTLINPMITQFAHDTYDYDMGNGVMTNRMTLDYEYVQYNEGAFNGDDTPVPAMPYFADAASYDKESSPISIPGANGKILGPAGIVDGVGSFVGNLLEGDIVGAAKIAGATYNNLKTFDVKSAAKLEAENLLRGALGSLSVGKTRKSVLSPKSNNTGSIQDLQEVKVTGTRRSVPTAGRQLSGGTGTGG